MNYYIADLHFGHKGIIKRSNRPFETVEEMDKALIENWNSTVTDDDDVYILGDVAWKSPETVKILWSLRGRKHLVIGNHDIKLLESPRFRKCFVEIHTIIEITDNGERIVLCHYPMAEWNGYHRGYWHFHGHIHNNKNEANEIMSRLPRCVNVGADCIGFTPRTAKELMG